MSSPTPEWLKILPPKYDQIKAGLISDDCPIKVVEEGDIEKIFADFSDGEGPYYYLYHNKSKNTYYCNIVSFDNESKINLTRKSIAERIMSKDIPTGWIPLTLEEWNYHLSLMGEIEDIAIKDLNISLEIKTFPYSLVDSSGIHTKHVFYELTLLDSHPVDYLYNSGDSYWAYEKLYNQCLASLKKVEPMLASRLVAAQTKH